MEHLLEQFFSTRSQALASNNNKDHFFIYEHLDPPIRVDLKSPVPESFRLETRLVELKRFSFAWKFCIQPL